MRSFGLSALLVPSAGWKELPQTAGPSPMRMASTSWRMSCCARLRIMRAVRSCMGSYTKKSFDVSLLLGVCYTSVKTERWSFFLEFFLDRWSLCPLLQRFWTLLPFWKGCDSVERDVMGDERRATDWPAVREMMCCSDRASAVPFPCLLSEEAVLWTSVSALHW